MQIETTAYRRDRAYLEGNEFSINAYRVYTAGEPMRASQVK